ncbi:Putative metal chaperone YciC [Falsiruegeria litorea R37]|uniref:Putative metal chaperone YciC n=1 Tax=Falsiruegeria litorea R37 TaxID=1200284 RepID=A0A1Y5TUY6_9RHOB|nr:GTP-binding protein [Falsiruegeria litorea]SLN73224.1 Putative metal chaperone YciC [Falsiruegeria litorea R37]
MIPVCIVSGYLGAGKTTLIRDFLRAPGGLRATVLVNDFGQINIDAELIAQTGVDTIALTNGCACCSIGDDLLGAAQSAVQDEPDIMIIEASGVAQPARIAHLLHGVVGTRSARCLTVMNLARARQLSRDKFVANLFRQQIDQAHGLSVNRTAAHARGWTSNHPQYPTLGAFIADNKARTRSTATEMTKGTNFVHRVFHPRPMKEAELMQWLMTHCPNLHRAKGLVPLKLASGKTIMARLDFVQGDWALERVPNAQPDPFGQIVAISPVT